MDRLRSTKIVATLGPATDRPGVVDALIDAGVDCVRVNCSYDGPDKWRERVRQVRASDRRRDRPVPVMFDLQGAKIRFAAATPSVELAAGSTVTLVRADTAGAASDGALPVECEGFSAMVDDRAEIVIGDGTPRLSVVEHGNDIVIANVVTAGQVAPGKGLTVTRAHTACDTLTAKDRADLRTAIECDAEFVALSYVSSAADVAQLRSLLDDAGSTARTIAKIEREEAYDRLDEILELADGVMVARGDLGIAVGTERVPLMQKDIIRRATQSGKLVITATQMLESMIEAAEPTRAEAADIANAVIDGSSAVMLSAETGVGAYPVEAVARMSAIAAFAEHEHVRGATSDAFSEQQRDEAVMHAALYLSHATHAAALVVPTTSGNTARACAKYRPRIPIIAITSDTRVAAQLNLEWGVIGTPHLQEHVGFEHIGAMLDQAKRVADLPTGALVVMTAGPRAGQSGTTNMIALHELP